MKTFINLLCALLLTNLSFAQQRIKPQTKNTKTIITTGKTNSTYYNLSKQKPVTVTVSGPGELVVYTRTLVNQDRNSSRPFILKYKVDGKRVKTKKVPKKQKSLRSRVKKNTKTLATKAHKVRIKIPDGKHTYSFYRQTSKQKVITRFSFEKQTKSAWKEIKSKHLKPVILKDLNNKKTVNYAQISNKESFSFKTTNNTSRIRLFFRANFNYKMLEDCVNRLEIKIDGKPTAFKIASKKSSRLENITHSELIPGALEKIYIDVPAKGNHTIEISLNDDTNTSGLIRVFASTNKFKNGTYEKLAFSY